jgi:hypothetical protein
MRKQLLLIVRVAVLGQKCTVVLSAPEIQYIVTKDFITYEI